MKTKQKSPARVLLVGCQFSHVEADSVEFYTDKHFLDYDIVVLDPRGALHGQSHDYHVLDGILELDRREGVRFRKRLAIAQGKLVEFVNKGRTAIIFVRQLPTLKHPSERSSAFTDLVDLNQFMPWDKNSLVGGEGQNIAFRTHDAFKDFWAETGDIWTYNARFKSSPELPLAHVAGYEDDVVAAAIRTKELGYAVMTPVAAFDSGLADECSLHVKRFLDAVRALDANLHAAVAASDLPDWTANYHLPDELEEIIAIAETERGLHELQLRLEAQANSLHARRLHKLLFTSHDSPLEEAVDRVLTELGMEVVPGPKRRVDRIATYGDQLLAIEIQGVKAGAKENHARSLTQWVQDVAVEKGKEPNGLLVVNTFRETELGERTGNSWPGETLAVCTKQGHCAITGLQLLGLYLDALKHPDKKDELVRRLFETVGEFLDYKDWHEFIVVPPEASEE